MSSLNKCCFIGNMGKDPEIRTMQNGKQVASFSLAVTETWKDKNTGEKKQDTEWVDCSCFIATELLKNYTQKGSRIYVEGKLKTEKYTDKNGVEKFVKKIKISSPLGRVILLDGKQQGQGYNQQNFQAPAQQQTFHLPLDDSIPF